MKRLGSLLAVFGMAFVFSTKAFAFAEEPFQTSAIDPARALVESVGINNWLSANYARISPVQVQGAREHLHALIDSRIKELYARDKVLKPPQPDPRLAMLYSWAGRLGVFGADAVYAAVQGTHPAQPPAGPRPPEGLNVALQGESLVISSAAGEWQASVPFHFFIFVLVKTAGNDSMGQEGAVISTGSAPDAAPPGYSQATLAVYFTHGADMKSFEPQWSERLQIPLTGEQRAVGQTKYRSRKVYDEPTRLHKEVVFIPTRGGAMAVLYAGLDGTYQVNRPHYLDFLGGLKVSQ